MFMAYNAIGQAAQPILSYNFGAGHAVRVKRTFYLALFTAVTCGGLFLIGTILFDEQIVAMFMKPSCMFGLPLILNVRGIWLAMPLAETLTSFIIMIIYHKQQRLNYADIHN